MDLDESADEIGFHTDPFPSLVPTQPAVIFGSVPWIPLQFRQMLGSRILLTR